MFISHLTRHRVKFEMNMKMYQVHEIPLHVSELTLILIMQEYPNIFLRRMRHFVSCKLKPMGHFLF